MEKRLKRTLSLLGKNKIRDIIILKVTLNLKMESHFESLKLNKNASF